MDRTDWELSIALPLDGEGPVGTLWTLDPMGTFLTTVGTVRTTSMLVGPLLRRLAVVGVAARVEGAEPLQRRVLDLTPTTPEAPRVIETGPWGTGGADRFLDALEILIPRVEAEHGFDPGERTLAGWSLGGLFTSWCLLTRPELFRRYLAVSPSLWWDSRRLLGMDVPDLTGRSVHLTVGEDELGWPDLPPDALERVSGIDMVDDLGRFAERLAGSGVELTHEVVAKENHITVWGGALARGLVVLHG